MVSSLDPPHALLCDFGISTFKGLDRRVHTTNMTTNERWLPCEQFDGVYTRLTNVQSDVYAFGCLILEVQ